MPKALRKNKRKALDDCHVLICWSELQKMVKENFACAACGEQVTDFNQRTIGIATELDFYCKCCKLNATAEAMRSNYMTTQSDKDFSCRKRWIDNYELNW
jgi:predicted amidophosphoribosyltransferase